MVLNSKSSIQMWKFNQNGNVKNRNRKSPIILYLLPTYVNVTLEKHDQKRHTWQKVLDVFVWIRVDLPHPFNNCVAFQSLARSHFLKPNIGGAFWKRGPLVSTFKSPTSALGHFQQALLSSGEACTGTSMQPWTPCVGRTLDLGAGR